jgi:hypothetical protein
MCEVIGDLDHLSLWDALWFTTNRADPAAWWYGIADTATTLAILVFIIYAVIRRRSVFKWVPNKWLEKIGVDAEFSPLTFAKSQVEIKMTRNPMTSTDRIACWALVVVVPVLVMLIQPAINPMPWSFMFMDCVMISTAFVASFRLSRLTSGLFERILAILFCVVWFVVILLAIIGSIK